MHKVKPVAVLRHAPHAVVHRPRAAVAGPALAASREPRASTAATAPALKAAVATAHVLMVALIGAVTTVHRAKAYPVTIAAHAAMAMNCHATSTP